MKRPQALRKNGTPEGELTYLTVPMLNNHELVWRSFGGNNDQDRGLQLLVTPVMGSPKLWKL